MTCYFGMGNRVIRAGARRHLDPALRQVLSYLEHEAWRGRGWWRRGVRGWRLGAEIEVSTERRTTDAIPSLWERGYVDRIQVADPGRQTPSYLYRISQAGWARYCSATGAPTLPIPEPLPASIDPDVHAIYIPAGHWHLLDLLRRYAMYHLGPVRGEQYGWMTPSEVRVQLRGAVGDTLPWLLGRGLVERRPDLEINQTARPTWIYRVSPYALGLELIDAAVLGPLGSVAPLYVQLRPRSIAP